MTASNKGHYNKRGLSGSRNDQASAQKMHYCTVEGCTKAQAGRCPNGVHRDKSTIGCREDMANPGSCKRKNCRYYHQPKRAGGCQIVEEALVRPGKLAYPRKSPPPRPAQQQASSSEEETPAGIYTANPGSVRDLLKGGLWK